ncbi:MAG: C25 family cysteine peptidase [bacterium]
MFMQRWFVLARMISVIAAISLAMCAFGASSIRMMIAPAGAEWKPLFGKVAMPAEVTAIKADLVQSTLKLNIAGLHQLPIRRDKMSFTRLSIPDAGLTNEIGRPEVPMVRQLVAVPDGAEVTLEVTSGEAKTEDNLDVYPVQDPVAEANPGLLEMPFKQDLAFYKLDAAYPPQLARISEPMKIRDVTVVLLEMSPMQYSAGKRQLTVYNDLDVKLNFKMPKANIRTPIRDIKPITDIKATDKTLLADKAYILNADIYKIIKNIKLQYDYLIITPDAYVANLQPLVDWKRERGLSVKVAKLSETGTTVDKIKAYIQDMYTNNNISYVLLVGDTNAIPAYMYNGDTASDYNYSLVSGTDYLADIAVGRFSVRSAAEVDNMVKKSVDYEKTPYTGSTAWYKKATCISDEGYFQDTSNWVAGFITVQGYTVQKLYKSSGNATIANVTAAINDGRAIVNYRGHGGQTSWDTSGFGNANVNALTNGQKLPVIISPTCLTGCYDYGPTDSFSEVWLKSAANGTPHGAVAYWGSSRISYGGYNDELCKGAYKALFNDGIDTMGNIVNKSKIYMLTAYGLTDTAKFELHFFNLFGDPELHPWTAAP